MHDRDLSLFEGDVEVVQLGGLEIQLVERKCELVGVDLARAVPALEQPCALLGREDLLDRCSRGSALCFFSGQTAPQFLARTSHGSCTGGGRQKAPQGVTLQISPVDGLGHG
jgi:hypothetical protein